MGSSTVFRFGDEESFHKALKVNDSSSSRSLSLSLNDSTEIYYLSMVFLAPLIISHVYFPSVSFCIPSVSFSFRH